MTALLAGFGGFRVSPPDPAVISAPSGYGLGALIGIALVASAVVWAVLWLAALRGRGSSGRAFAVLFIIALISAAGGAVLSGGESRASFQARRLQGADPFYQALQQTFPDEHARLQALIAADLNAGVTLDEAERRARLRRRELLLKLAPLAAAAPTSELRAIFHSELAVLRQFQKDDVRLCAEFGMHGLAPETAISLEAERLGDESVRLRLRAARAGRYAPVSRRAPGSQDALALAQAMRRNGAAEDWTAGPRQSPQDQCTGSIAFYQALVELPDEVGGPLMSAITVAAAKSVGAYHAGPAAQPK